MAEGWHSVRRAAGAPLGVALGFTWLTLIVHVVIEEVAVRATTAGGILAQQIDKLPLFLARPIYTILWFFFFLGWIVSLFLGLKWLFDSTESHSVH